MLRLLLCAAAAALVGCAPAYKDTPPPADHPGNADATPAPQQSRARILELPAGKTEADTGAPGPGSHDGPGAIYACPMHPEVTSDLPDHRCPKCGMKLVKKDRPGDRP